MSSGSAAVRSGLPGAGSSVRYGPRVPDVSFRATTRRSVELLRAFRLEQTQPDVFYGTLARDSAAQVDALHGLEGARLLDVGGGPGYFADAFQARGARYVGLDADAGEMALHGRTPGPRTVLGDGTALPFLAGAFDVAYSSNVAEHVDRPWRMADEMVRVLAPGGLLYLSYTLWFGPWGGHETSPWHYLGGRRAADRYAHRHGRRPKNDYGRSLFRVTAGDAARWAREQDRSGTLADVRLLARYLPGWASWVVTVPGVREVVCWNVVVVGRRR
jgi:SAM-dependent methyltransferase